MSNSKKKYDSKEEYEEEVNDKLQMMINLIEKNEHTPLIQERINEYLGFLCEAKVHLSVKFDGTKICRYCFNSFLGPNQDRGKQIITVCKCMSFHQECLMDICKDNSKELDMNVLDNKICCQGCGKPFTNGFIETSLGEILRKERERLEAIKNRKVLCQLCKHENKFDKMYERHCGHGFCTVCFKHYLEEIIKKKKGNIRDFVCPAKDCQEPALDEQELKVYVEKSILNLYDDYLFSIFNPKKRNDTIFKCSNEECSYIKTAPIDCKDAEYTCLNCLTKKGEENKKDDK